MSISSVLALLIMMTTVCAEEAPRVPMLGQTVDPAGWDLTVDRHGRGLPQGSGTPEQGQQIYQEKCEKCHGPQGRGASAEELVGGVGSLSSAFPDRTLGSYWPYAPSIFDYIRRAMPIDAPLSLSDQEVYAVTAYLLYLNGLVPEDQTLDAASLSRLRMPNRTGFIPEYGAAKSP